MDVDKIEAELRTLKTSFLPSCPGGAWGASLPKDNRQWKEENEKEIGDLTFFCLRLCPLEQMLMPSRVWGEGLPAIKS